MTFISKIAISRPRLIRHRKRIFDDGMILEMALWDVPVPGRAHRLEYVLSYGNAGGRSDGNAEGRSEGNAEGRLIGYDNTAGDHDHRRYRGQEVRRYRFVSPERLVADFLMDVRQVRNDG